MTKFINEVQKGNSMIYVQELQTQDSFGDVIREVLGVPSSQGNPLSESRWWSGAFCFS